jgi:sec-independent protein translocase protein TatC
MKLPPKKKSLKKHPPKRQPFSEHLRELRTRIIWILFVFLLGSGIGYILRDYILSILIKPLNQTIFYTSPAGGFNFVINISLFFGFLFALPMIVYQTVRFVEPALPKKFPKLFLTIFASSTILLITGISFAYFISLPAALYFLNTFTTSEIRALISTDEYFSFVIHYLLGFGLVFQLPLIILAINAVKKISVKTLLGYERWIILISFIIAAILTPTPDMLNQIIMALPLILLYQLTIVIIWFVNRKVYF